MVSPPARPAAGRRLRLQPFHGLRFSPAAVPHLSEVSLAPPALWDFAALAGLARTHDHHVLRLLAPSLTAGATAEATARRWVADGTLSVDPSPGLYVWRWSQQGLSVVGVAGALELPAAGVWPHEQVRPGLLAERATELGTGAVQPEPILMLYDGTQPLAPQAVQTSALVALDLDDGRHAVHRISHPEGNEQVNHALDGAPLVVADGHHRFRVLSDLPAPRPRAFVLVVDVRRSELAVGPIPRVVPGVGWDAVSATPGAVLVALDDGDRNGFLEAVPPGRLRWIVADPSRTVGLELSTAATEALGRSSPADPCGAVARDVCELHQHLLARWGVGADRVQYAHSWDTARAQAGAIAGLAVQCRPPGLDQVMAAARAGTLLPHKATSISPKPRTGLLMLGDAVGPA